MKEKLSYVDSSRENRQKNAAYFLENPKDITNLMIILFKNDHPSSSRAAWLLENACCSNLDIIIPHLEFFTDNIHTIEHESAIRPVAKICELLVKLNHRITSKEKQIISRSQTQKIVEFCFDIMIKDHKVAPKAFSMSCLELIGYSKKWIHGELINILERDFNTQSKGFQSRAKHILKRIK